MNYNKETHEEVYYSFADADLRAIVLLKSGWQKADICYGFDDNDKVIYRLKVTRSIPIVPRIMRGDG